MKSEIKAMRWTGFGLLVVFIIILTTGRIPISSLLIPSTVSEYHGIIGDPKQDFRDKWLGIGSILKLRVRSGIKSLDGKYALEYVLFFLSDGSNSIWDGEKTQPDWDETIFGDKMKKARINVKIRIPNNPALEGKTINGSLKVRVLYPSKTGSTSGIIMKTGKFTNYTEEVIKPISVHIFSANELRRLSALWTRLTMVWGAGMEVVFLTALSLLIISFGKQGASEELGCFLPTMAFGMSFIPAALHYYGFPGSFFLVTILIFVISYFVFRMILARIVKFCFYLDLGYLPKRQRKEEK